MKRQIIFSVLVALSLMLLASCSKDDGNPAGPETGGTTGSTNNSGQPMPALGNNSAGIMATINYEFQTAPGFPAVAISMAFAQFGEGVDAGNVNVNGNSISKTTQGGTTFYVAPSPSNPTQTLSGVNFNGSSHSWQVGGGNGVPSLSGSVNSPTNFGVSAPSNNATVSKANGIDVRWNNTGSGSRVLVVLAPINNSNQYFEIDDLDDNGSYTIPSAEISGFSGEAMLQVVKYNYAAVNAGGSDYYIISEVVKSITLTIN